MRREEPPAAVVHACLLEAGTPAVVLRAAILEEGADLAVIGAHPRGMLFDAVIGSSRSIVDAMPGDLLVVATDGFTDSVAPDGSYYGVDRLADAIARVSQRDAHVIVNTLLDDVDAFRQGRPASDDQTVLVLKAPVDVP